MAAVQQVIGEARAKVYQLEARQRDQDRTIRNEKDLTQKFQSDKR